MNVFQFLAVTTDSASNNSTFVTEFVNEVHVKWNLYDVRDPDCHVHCFAHILNLAVQDLLAELKCNAPRDEREADGESHKSKGPLSIIMKVFNYIYFG